MNRVLKLYKMLNKNDEIKASGKTAAFIIIGIIVVLILGYVGYNFAEIITEVGGISTILTVAGTFSGIAILMIGFFLLVNSMYMSSDIELLITMPFSALEIVFIRMIPFIKMAYGIAAVLILPIGITYSVASGVEAMSIIGIILELLVVPIFAVAFTTALVILIMSVIRVFRNMDVLRYIGVIGMFILLVLYFYFIGRDNNGAANAQSIITVVASIGAMVKYVVPVSGFIVD